MVEYMHSDPCSHRTTDTGKPKKSLLASSPLVILRFPFVLAKCQECNDINSTKINDKIFVHVFYKKTKFQNSAPFTSRNSYLFLLFYHIFRNLFKQDFTISAMRNKIFYFYLILHHLRILLFIHISPKFLKVIHLT